jgi:hypothetical protein
MMVHMFAKEIVLGVFLLPLMYMLVKELFSRFYYDGVYACKRNNSLRFYYDGVYACKRNNSFFFLLLIIKF